MYERFKTHLLIQMRYIHNKADFHFKKFLKKNKIKIKLQHFLNLEIHIYKSLLGVAIYLEKWTIILLPITDTECFRSSFMFFLIFYSFQSYTFLKYMFIHLLMK